MVFENRLIVVLLKSETKMFVKQKYTGKFSSFCCAKGLKQFLGSILISPIKKKNLRMKNTFSLDRKYEWWVAETARGRRKGRKVKGDSLLSSPIL